MSEKKMMLGNEAIARGVFEAGVKVSSAYPGTPSTEISEYRIIWEFDSHLWGSPQRRVLTSCGTFTIRSWPKVSFAASRTSKATVATARRQLGHLVATLSSCFEK